VTGAARSRDGSLEAYDRALVSRVRGVLADDLVGVYLTGSRALGAYRPGRSDTDVMAVCRTPPPPTVKRRIVARLRHEALPCPARLLEFVLYADRAVAAGDGGFEINLNTGRATPCHASFDAADEPPFWFVIDRAIVREYGIALLGPPASEVFGAIPRERILDALRQAHQWHTDSGEARRDDVVLNACRAWRYIEEEVWSSKAAAGEWARSRVDDAGLIDAALAGRDLPEEDADRFLTAFARRAGW
jgi:hypothetical protein